MSGEGLVERMTGQSVRVQVPNVGTVTGFLRRESAEYLAGIIPTPVPSDVAETTAGEREVEACPAKWCAYPMPHDHTSGSGPTFDALLSDPTQQLDTEGVVLASVLAHQAEPRRLTTAEREWLDDSMMHGFDTLVSTVERLMDRAANEVRLTPALLDRVRREEGERIAQAIEELPAHYVQSTRRGGTGWVQAVQTHEAVTIARAASVGRGEGQ